MEFEYSDKNRRRSKIYIAVGIVIALLVAATVFVALQASGLTADRDVPRRDVVVAVQEIPARKAIEEADVAVRSVVADPTNESAFTSLDQVLGRVVGVAVPSGQLITLNMLASTTEGQTFSILEPGEEFDPNGPDWRALSLSVGDTNAVAGTLVPGQRVDLIVTMPVNPELGLTAEQVEAGGSQYVAGPSTKVTLQQVLILARTGGAYIVRTDLTTAEKITELQAVGANFTMVMRAEEDDRTAETEGSTVDRLLEEYDFPLPQRPEFEEQSARN